MGHVKCKCHAKCLLSCMIYAILFDISCCGPCNADHIFHLLCFEISMQSGVWSDLGADANSEALSFFQ